MRHAFIAFLVAILLVACGSSAASQAPDADATGKPSKSMHIGGNTRVLIVDDSSGIRSIFVTTLQSVDGYTVSTAENGEMAMKSLDDTAKESLPHIILIDNYMPGQSGFQLTRALTSDARYKGIPVIMLLIDPMSDAQKAKQSGARGWLPKPFQVSALLQIIERLVPR